MSFCLSCVVGVEFKESDNASAYRPFTHLPPIASIFCFFGGVGSEGKLKNMALRKGIVLQLMNSQSALRQKNLVWVSDDDHAFYEHCDLILCPHKK